MILIPKLNPICSEAHCEFVAQHWCVIDGDSLAIGGTIKGKGCRSDSDGLLSCAVFGGQANSPDGERKAQN